LLLKLKRASASQLAHEARKKLANQKYYETHARLESQSYDENLYYFANNRDREAERVMKPKEQHVSHEKYVSRLSREIRVEKCEP
jgi:hypothetical protein